MKTKHKKTTKRNAKASTKLSPKSRKGAKRKYTSAIRVRIKGVDTEDEEDDFDPIALLSKREKIHANGLPIAPKDVADCEAGKSYTSPNGRTEIVVAPHVFALRTQLEKISHIPVPTTDEYQQALEAQKQALRQWGAILTPEALALLTQSCVKHNRTAKEGERKHFVPCNTFEIAGLIALDVIPPALAKTAKLEKRLTKAGKK